MFGRPVPQEIINAQGEPIRYWGARVIFNECREAIRFVPGRSTAIECKGDRSPDPMSDWLRNKALKALVAMPQYQNLTSDSDEVVEFKDRQFTLQCCPNSSYGYLYLGAWQYYPKDCEYEMKTLPEYVTKMEVEQIKWSNTNIAPPPIGSTVECNFNGKWTGKVTGYFVEHGFLGIEIAAETSPEYFKRQSPHSNRALMFGADLVSVK